MDNLKIKQISRDVYVDENSHTYEAIEITQGTNGGIELVFYLYENGIPYILQNSDSIKYKLIGARPDGEAIIRYPKSVSENILVFDNITSYMTCIAGTYSVRIEMADLNGTSNILVNDIQLSIIQNSFYNSNIISTDEYSVLMYELNNLDRLTSKIVSNETNVTNSGIALDARQNNPDIDGTLRKQINVLYNNKVDKSAIVHNADISDADKVPGMDLINNMQGQITMLKENVTDIGWTDQINATGKYRIMANDITKKASEIYLPYTEDGNAGDIWVVNAIAYDSRYIGLYAIQLNGNRAGFGRLDTQYKTIIWIKLS